MIDVSVVRCPAIQCLHVSDLVLLARFDRYSYVGRAHTKWPQNQHNLFTFQPGYTHLIQFPVSHKSSIYRTRDAPKQPEPNTLTRKLHVSNIHVPSTTAYKTRVPTDPLYPLSQHKPNAHTGRYESSPTQSTHLESRPLQCRRVIGAARVRSLPSRVEKGTPVYSGRAWVRENKACYRSEGLFFGGGVT